MTVSTVYRHHKQQPKYGCYPHAARHSSRSQTMGKQDINQIRRDKHQHTGNQCNPEAFGVCLTEPYRSRDDNNDSASQ